MTSGACGPGLSLLALIASISSPEPAFGSSSLTARPYLALKPSMTRAVVAPVVRQGDRGQRALGLGGLDQGGHRIGRGRHLDGGRRDHRGHGRRGLGCATATGGDDDRENCSAHHEARHRAGSGQLLLQLAVRAPCVRATLL